MTHEDRIARAANLLRVAQATRSAVFSTSLGLEDQVLTDLIVRHAPQIAMFTLDTGRLPPETHEVLARTRVEGHGQIHALAARIDAENLAYVVR